MQFDEVHEVLMWPIHMKYHFASILTQKLGMQTIRRCGLKLRH